MTKRIFGSTVLLFLGLAVLSACSADSTTRAGDLEKTALKIAAEKVAKEETTAEEKTAETEAAQAEEKTAKETAAEEKTAETEAAKEKAAGKSLASRMAGVYSCEQDGEYHTLELFEFGGNLLGQGGIAMKPEGKDPAELYSFWALELVPADAGALLSEKGDSFEAGILQFSVMSNMSRYWGTPVKDTVRLTDKGILFSGMEYVRENREGTAFTDVTPMFGGMEPGTVPEKLPGLWKQKNGGEAPVFLEFSEDSGPEGSGSLRIYRKVPGKEVLFCCGRFFFDKDGKFYAGSSFLHNAAPVETMNADVTFPGNDTMKIVLEGNDSLFGEGFSLGEKAEFERVSPDAVPVTVLAEPDDMEALQGTKSVKTDSGERSVISQFLGTEDIENNGGYFVRVGDLVFFRDYSGVTEKLTGVSGDFLHDSNLGKGSRFCCFDKASGKTTVLSEDEGSGPLYYVNGMFYFKGQTGLSDGTETEGVYRCWPDGSGRELFSGDGYAGVSAVSRTGHKIYIHQYGKNPQGILTDGTIYGTFLDMPADEIHFFSDFDGDDLILAVHDGKKGENRVLRIDGTTGEETVLGIIPGIEADSWGYPSIEQMYLEGEDLYLGAAWYAGTAHMLQDYMVLKMNARKADSLTVLKQELPEGSGEGGPAPKFYFNYNNELLFTEHDPKGEAALSEDSSGDLVWYDSPFGATVLQKDFVKKNWYEAKDGETVPVLQKAEFVDGDVYLLMAEAVRTPEEDIGWRMGFTMKKMYQQRIAVKDVASSDYTVVQLP
ncbi:MAG: hypothetical protein IJT43_01295 [Stomatobaculum sp.]|nr:hypothetical protein [Stomatobaculum sp.]